MTAQHLPGDEAFFDEWLHRKPGTNRSLDRARQVGEALGLWPFRPVVLTVVGSKGKGTAAIHAAATLSAARIGHSREVCVGLVTSPGLRTNRERMRIDGDAISPVDYEAVAADLRAARAAVPPTTDSYLSPTGAFTISGAHWAARNGADVLVLEEGLGGASDEVSLFDPTIVLVTEIFLEHAGLLGSSITAIARDLLGVVKTSTHTIATLSQSPAVMGVIEEVAQAHGATVSVLGDLTVPVRSDLAVLSRRNAAAGVAAGLGLVDALDWTVTEDALAMSLGTVSTPGRCSRHVLNSRRRTIPVMLDGAISPAGVRASVSEYVSWRGTRGTVVACFPDTKDVEACFAELAGFDTVIAVRVGDYLQFEVAERLFGSLPSPTAALTDLVAADGFLALGTQSFVAEMLDLLDAPTDVAYSAKPGPRTRR